MTEKIKSNIDYSERDKGTGEKHHKSVGFRDVISIKSLVFFRMLTYLLRYVRVPVDLVPNVPYKVRYELYSLL